jgi:hypothetical protein
VKRSAAIAGAVAAHRARDRQRAAGSDRDPHPSPGNHGDGGAAHRQGRLVGDDYPSTTVDFQRDASLTIDLTAGGGLLPWTDAGSNPLADLKKWALAAKKLSGVYPRVVHMGVDLFATFVSHAKVEKRWQAQNAQIINIGLKLGDALETAETYMGHIEGFEIYVYNDWYVDPVDDVEKEVLPSNELIMASPQAEGTRLYGAIQDLQGLQARRTSRRAGKTTIRPSGT